MSHASEEIKLRKKVGPTSLFLHIPYLNYLIFLFQIRGAYNAVRNYYLLERKLPSFLVTQWLIFKFSALSTIASICFYIILLLMGLNPFGKVASFYMMELGIFIGSLLPAKQMVFLFGHVPQRLMNTTFKAEGIITVAIFTLVTYLLFGFLGALLAEFNIRADMRRNKYL